MSTAACSGSRATGLSVSAVLVVVVSIVLAAVTSACDSSESGDCIDAVMFKGRMYTDVRDVPGYSGPSQVDNAELGEQAMVVTRENCGGVLEDGEATTLDAGTPVYLVSSDVNLLAAGNGSSYLLFIAVDKVP